jgi:hypothetical protein
MIFIKFLLAFIFLFLDSVYSVEDVSDVTDKSVRLNLYKSPIGDKSVLFSVEKLEESQTKFEFISLVTNEFMKKWDFHRIFSEKKPVFDVLQTWELTNENSVLLRTSLKNPGLDSESDSGELIQRFQEVSSISEFLNMIKMLPKTVNVDRNGLSSSNGGYFVTAGSVIVAVATFARIYQLINGDYHYHSKYASKFRSHL